MGEPEVFLPSFINRSALGSVNELQPKLFFNLDDLSAGGRLSFVEFTAGIPKLLQVARVVKVRKKSVESSLAIKSMLISKKGRLTSEDHCKNNSRTIGARGQVHKPREGFVYDWTIGRHPGSSSSHVLGNSRGPRAAATTDQFFLSFVDQNSGCLVDRERCGAIREVRSQRQPDCHSIGKHLVSALITGDIDVLGGPASTSMLATEAGLPVVIIGTFGPASRKLVVLPRIQSAEELRGKTIGVSNFGTIIDYSVRGPCRSLA